jgi:branched-chain amino acid transport system substrate-binding protein
VTVIGQALARTPRRSRRALLERLEGGTFDTWRGPVAFSRGEEHWHHSPPRFCLMQYQRPGQSLDEAAVIHPAAVRTHDYRPPR